VKNDLPVSPGPVRFEVGTWLFRSNAWGGITHIPPFICYGLVGAAMLTCCMCYHCSQHASCADLRMNIAGEVVTSMRNLAVRS